MPLTQEYSDSQLHRIINAGLVYTCACPAQVARQLLELRRLHDYQTGCLEQSSSSDEVHALIEKSVAACHAELERCLTRVLDIEGWDKTTLEMPAGLRQLRDAQLNAD